MYVSRNPLCLCQPLPAQARGFGDACVLTRQTADDLRDERADAVTTAGPSALPPKQGPDYACTGKTAHVVLCHEPY